MNKENKIKYVEALGNLMSGIKENYKNWGSDIDSLSDSQKKIRLEMIDRFNRNLDIRSGRKFDKVVSNGSVWGFVAKTNGKLKGIPYFVGDVFKPASIKAPAKGVRYNMLNMKSRQEMFERADWAGSYLYIR